MDKTLLKNFAIYSRNKLIQEITNKAAMIGITEEGITPPLSDSTSDLLMFDIKAIDPYFLKGTEINQYSKLINELEEREENSDYQTAYETLIEEIAYTWFNRLIAIRFMEVNNYIPHRMRVLSSGLEGVNEPELVTNYMDSGFDFTDEESNQLVNWKLDGSASAMDSMFRYLFIKQANALNDNLPELFEQTDDYAELLLTISYNDPEGVLYKLVHEVPEEYFDVEADDGDGQVEIIGWLYQYYNTEKKDEVFARPKSKKIPKEDVPAVTQLFTPDWIVKYMVENSLGRLWIEKLIADGDTRIEKEIAEDFGWEYYIPEAKQEDLVKEQLIEIRKGRKELSLEDITFMDPAMGSFHIGVYAFDIFMQLYESQGYTRRDTSQLIIENNLYGIDIDQRAYQLSYFAIMMKGRQYNRRILDRKVQTNLYSITESNNINKNHLDYLGGNIEDKEEWNKIKENISEVLDLFEDAKEYGSILRIEDTYDFESMKQFVLNSEEETQISFETIGIEETQSNILSIISMADVLSSKYDVIVTNPPYLGSNGMNIKLSKYVNKYYPDSKSDLFAVFMEFINDMLAIDGISSLVTMQSWMFLSSYEKLRYKLIDKNTIIQLMHMNNMVMRIAFGTAVSIFKKDSLKQYKGTYHKVKNEDLTEKGKPNIFPKIDERYNVISQDAFVNIPGMPIAYWLSYQSINNFKGEKLKNKAEGKVGLITGNNSRFLRFWYEVRYDNIGFNMCSISNSIISEKRWFPYQKGGLYRKWYGNNEYVVDWENDGYRMKHDNYSGKRVRSHNYNGKVSFKEGISWSSVTSGSFSSRYVSSGYLYDAAGPFLNVYKRENIFYVLGLISTKISSLYLNVLNPTINMHPGYIESLPLILSEKDRDEINYLVKQNINISKKDWNYFEKSWDFEKHFLLDENHQKKLSNTIKESYENWKEHTNNSFNKLKRNEEKLNRIFIDIYGLEQELTPEVSDKDITITKIFDQKNEIYDDIRGNQYIQTKEEIVKSFISYAVGCMFGRYSFDEGGLAYAGGEWNSKKYKSFIPTKDNVLLITTEEYFEDDIVNRFVEFIEVAYGKEKTEENLQFITDSLTGRGTSREKLRNYFVNNFYQDHCKIYSVRGSGKLPIYWLYDSSAGKTKRNSEDGFKALVYMHRYDEDTTGKVRMDYLHKVQRAYEFKMDNLKYEIDHSENAREVADAEKELEKLTKQVKECQDYDEKIGHLALSRIPIDLDDGVKVNYQKVQTDEEGKKLKILAKI